jgi:hypothetical protein
MVTINAMNVDLEQWSRDLSPAFTAVGLTLVEHAVQVKHGLLVCHLCGKKHGTTQGHHSHMATDHSNVNEANFFISGSHCRSCLMQFRTNNDVIRHLRASERCLKHLKFWYPRRLEPKDASLPLPASILAVQKSGPTSPWPVCLGAVPRQYQCFTPGGEAEDHDAHNGFLAAEIEDEAPIADIFDVPQNAVICQGSIVALGALVRRQRRSEAAMPHTSGQNFEYKYVETIKHVVLKTVVIAHIFN